jgi:hypothetical protein
LKRRRAWRRTQYFLLRLIADWQGWPAPKLPRQADDEPLFAALPARWLVKYNIRTRFQD